jgi:4-hydroxy-3-polyprenylbenzoate decarboxylase
MYEDLREFIAQVEALGALRRIDGPDPLFELGGITEVAAGLPECPALLFDSIKGFPRGFRVFTNATVSAQRSRSASIRPCRPSRRYPNGGAAGAS